MYFLEREREHIPTGNLDSTRRKTIDRFPPTPPTYDGKFATTKTTIYQEVFS